MIVKIEKMDDFGRGIGYLDSKVIFVSNTLVGDEVEIEVVEDKKSYLIGKVLKYLNLSKLRIQAKCPFFGECTSCELQNMEYRIELEYKLSKINNLLRKNKISYEVNDIIKSKNRFNYRNKITLKVVDGNIGYFKTGTHDLTKIDYCYLVKNVINDFIRDLNYFHISNGEIIIRTNYKNELLVIINTKDSIDIDQKIYDKHKIIGVILNDECIYGEDFFVDKIGNFLFKISYDAFFQTNPYICEELCNLLNELVSHKNNLIDLYSGVGSLGISVSDKVNNICSVEINDNATKNGRVNALLNNVKNIDFICSDTNKILDYLKGNDIIILDPPRSGVTRKVIDQIIKEQIPEIIYISCEPNTLIRDLNILLNNGYDIKDFKLLDMFPLTYHVECCTLLSLK